jgi:hypothetical protein
MNGWGIVYSEEEYDAYCCRVDVQDAVAMATSKRASDESLTHHDQGEIA